jgi:excisionase family DNA binding protein
MYSTKDLNKLLGRSECRIRELAKEGKIPAQKVGSTWQFPREEIDKWFFEKKECIDNVNTLSVQPDQDEKGSSQPEEA